jgi:hypothetical protein
MPTITIVALALRLASHIKASYFERLTQEVGVRKDTDLVSAE